MGKLRKEAIGTHLSLITDYHSNGSYESLKDHVTLLDEKDYAIIIRTLNFERNDFTKDLLYVDKDAYDFLSKSYVLPNDILMNKIANPGNVYIMPDLACPVTCGMNLFLMRFDDEVNQRYMYYNMKNVEAYIKSFSHGTTTKTITKDDVRGIEIFVHEREDQDRIEKVLSTIDAKIDADRQLIEKLSDLLHLLYERWFMEYEFPVNGKDKATYRSSGNELVWDSTIKRKIPAGWKVIPLNERFTFDRGVEVGADNYSDERQEGYVSYYRVSDMDAECITYVDETLLNDTFLRREDVCVSFDGTVGKVSFGLEGGYSSGIRKIEDKEGVLNNAFMYTFFTSDYAQFVIDKFATGSNILHSSESINNLFIAYNEGVYKDFVELITPIFNRMLEAKKDLDKWNKTKEILLPALMNGQIVVVPK